MDSGLQGILVSAVATMLGAWLLYKQATKQTQVDATKASTEAKRLDADDEGDREKRVDQNMWAIINYQDERIKGLLGENAALQTENRQLRERDMRRDDPDPQVRREARKYD